jgi:hypothetical protein
LPACQGFFCAAGEVGAGVEGIVAFGRVLDIPILSGENRTKEMLLTCGVTSAKSE